MEYYFIKDDILPAPWKEMPDKAAFIGGKLDFNYVKDAYKKGYFPWFQIEDYPVWFHPNPRCILKPDKVKVSSSMKSILKKPHWKVTHNEHFVPVIKACAQTPRKGQDGTWLTDAFIHNYQQLHQKGLAHSIEVHKNDELVGGLYYLKINQMAFGESMFSKVSNASKIALIYLAEWCKRNNVGMIDCQVTTEHLISMGAEEVDRDTFIHFLNNFVNE